jgi:gamma-glutamyltranspeptidase / glutathione hydrolase
MPARRDRWPLSGRGRFSAVLLLLLACGLVVATRIQAEALQPAVDAPARSAPAPAFQPPPLTPGLQRIPAARPPAAAIASAHPEATAAGHAILAAGGNAFDAAVAVSAALAVVEPASSGLGGGGFYLVHRSADGWEGMLDARETAPGAAHRDMYLGADGEAIAALSRDGPLSAGIPGLPAALVRLAQELGRLPLGESLAPAIRLADEGFIVTPRTARMAGFRRAVLARFPASAAIFLPSGEAPREGMLLRQQDLASTLRAMAREGHAGFYTGAVAELLVEGVKSSGGIWTREDLADYRTVWRRPIIGSHRGVRVVSAPLPSSGGIVLLEALNILEAVGLPPQGTVERVHVVTEAMRRAYRDRAAWLGDPDFVQAPVAQLLDREYAADLAATIERGRATPSSELPPLPAPAAEFPNTTHLSVLDAEGNRVAATLSINLPFGSAFVAPGTGVLLNDEMDDFAARPMTPNAYGLVGLDANAIAPGKRPLSSMTPTFLDMPGRVAILGTPGGSRIISMVLLGTLAFLDGTGPQEWVARPRYHHQYLPDRLFHEPDAFDDASSRALQALGHTLEESGRRYGDMHAILWRLADGVVEAASDPRGEGAAEVRAVPAVAAPQP